MIYSRIDIRNQTEWRGTPQIFLKTWLPDIRTEAVFDIQCNGNVKGPPMPTLPRDFARFEVCVHKWLDLVEDDDYGVSFHQ